MCAVYVHISIYAGMCRGVCVHRCQSWQQVFSPNTSHFRFWGKVSLAESRAHNSSRHASHLALESGTLPPTCWDYRQVALPHGLWLDAGDPSPGAHACTARVCPLHHLPSPNRFFFLRYLSQEGFLEKLDDLSMWDVRYRLLQPSLILPELKCWLLR